MKCVTMHDPVKPKVLAPGMYSIDVEPIPPRNRNNTEVHLECLKHLKDSVGTLCEIVEEDRVEKPLDSSLASACLYTKHSQELLEYVIGTCPKAFNKRDRMITTAPLNRKKRVTFVKLGVNDATAASGFVKKPPVKKVWRVKQVKQVWQATGKLFTNVRFQWLPTGRKFTLGEQCSLTRSYRSSFDLEVAFRKHSCYVRYVNSIHLIKGNRGTNLYTVFVEYMMNSSHICLLSKASKNKSWLWHRRLNHLNFGTIIDLAQKDLVRGLPRLNFDKDHLCSACQLGKSQKYSHKPKFKNTNLEVLNTLHMDLCGPTQAQTINGKKYILVIIDDYSRYNRTDNGTEFVNQFLTEYYESVGIFHQKSVLRTPQQNDVVERRNRTLVEATRTMLIFSKALMFLWAEAVATACYT
ncbi:retrovirus-related pol polyprotein from transposon TNT 1-94 [Tanacetum coccineum]